MTFTKKNICRFLSSIFIIAIIFSCNKDQVEIENRPNIILIMADDLGYADLGVYGNDSIKTPHLDQLAKNGIRFTDFHSNGAVCSPTRAALMTGRYQQKSGIGGVVTALNHRHTGLDIDEFTMADFLKEEEYKTAIIGKWHLGYDTIFSPVNNGFEYFKGFVSGNIDYHSHIDQVGAYDWWQNKDTLVEEGYSTDMITKASLQFISEHKNDPFFLYMAHEAPHYPYQGRNDQADRTINGKFKVHGSRPDKKAAYKEMIEVMDEGIGKLITYLEENNLLSNTLILFLSDNGASKTGSNNPLKGFKGSLWEGGHRVPAIAYWKDRIQPGISDETLLTMDILPTLMDLVNPKKLNDYNLDGKSYLSLLLQKSDKTDFRNRPIFWRYGNKKAVRLNEWKLVLDQKKFLFNVKKDLREQNNLIDTNPKMKDSLMNLLNTWEEEVNQFSDRTN